MKLDPIQRELVTYGVLGVIAIGAGYIIIKYAIPAIAKAAADAAKKSVGSVAKGVGDTLNAANQGLSNNDLTQQQNDWGGNQVDYSGHGLLSTLGAESNALSGGALASWGSEVGKELFGFFGSGSSGSSTSYRTTFPDGSVHYVDSSNVDTNGRFTFSDGVTYQLGDDGTGKKVATALTTIYGSGSGGGALPADNFGLYDASTWQ